MKIYLNLKLHILGVQFTNNYWYIFNLPQHLTICMSSPRTKNICELKEIPSALCCRNINPHERNSAEEEKDENIIN